MKAIDVAVDLGVPIPYAERYLSECDDVVEADQYVAVLRKNVVHLAVSVRGLGGRKLLHDGRATLARWFERHPVLLAPVAHGNDKAVALGAAFGFRQYRDTEMHVWLMQTRENFHGH